MTTLIIVKNQNNHNLQNFKSTNMSYLILIIPPINHSLKNMLSNFGVKAIILIKT